jgi:phospholipid N-methyltransferase
MWTFFKEALGGIVSHGAVMPSTSFLAKDMLRPVDMKKGVVIVELGAGTGSFTKEILKRLPSDGKLVVLELNPILASHLKARIVDPRVIIVEGDAGKLGSYLKSFGYDRVDYIISGLPIGNFRRVVRERILSEINNNLSDTGRYIQFQYFLASWRHVRSVFDAKIIAYEVRNVPPAFVYECKKRIDFSLKKR